MLAVNCWPGTTGWLPSDPTETVEFCSATALVMSPGVNWYCASRSGSSQIRIA